MRTILVASLLVLGCVSAVYAQQIPVARPFTRAELVTHLTNSLNTLDATLPGPDSEDFDPTHRAILTLVRSCADAAQQQRARQEITLLTTWALKQPEPELGLLRFLYAAAYVVGDRTDAERIAQWHQAHLLKLVDAPAEGGIAAEMVAVLHAAGAQRALYQLIELDASLRHPAWEFPFPPRVFADRTILPQLTQRLMKAAAEPQKTRDADEELLEAPEALSPEDALRVLAMVSMASGNDPAALQLAAKIRDPEERLWAAQQLLRIDLACGGTADTAQGLWKLADGALADLKRTSDAAMHARWTLALLDYEPRAYEDTDRPPGHDFAAARLWQEQQNRLWMMLPAELAGVEDEQVWERLTEVLGSWHGRNGRQKRPEGVDALLRPLLEKRSADAALAMLVLTTDEDGARTKAQAYLRGRESDDETRDALIRVAAGWGQADPDDELKSAAIHLLGQPIEPALIGGPLTEIEIRDGWRAVVQSEYEGQTHAAAQLIERDIVESASWQAIMKGNIFWPGFFQKAGAHFYDVTVNTAADPATGNDVPVYYLWNRTDFDPMDASITNAMKDDIAYAYSKAVARGMLLTAARPLLRGPTLKSFVRTPLEETAAFWLPLAEGAYGD